MKATRALFGLMAAGALVMSACGSDDKADSTTPGNTGGTTVETTPSSETTPTGDTTPSGDTTPETTPAPGEAFDPSLPPVVVGFHNLEGGSYSIPESRIGFEKGVEYVNSQLGGINGHELKVEYCNLDVTPESAIDCANQFVEKGVAAAVQGYDLAVDAAMPVLTEAGILEMASAPLGAAINNNVGDAIVFGPSSQGGAGITAVVLAKNTGAKKLAYLLADVPAMRPVFDIAKAAADKLGIELEAYYYAQPTDWTTFAATVVSAGPDSVAMFGVDADYLAAVPAFRQAGFTGQFNASTLGAVDQLPADMRKDVVVAFPYYNVDMVSGVPDEAKADIDVFEAALKGNDALGRPGPARIGFFMAVQAADALRQVDDPTSAAAVFEQAPKAKGHAFFTDQDYDCSTPSWPDTTSCLGLTIYASINEDGKLDVIPGQPFDLSIVA